MYEFQVFSIHMITISNPDLKLKSNDIIYCVLNSFSKLVKKIVFSLNFQYHHQHRNPQYHPTNRKDIPSKATGNGDDEDGESPFSAGNGSGPMSLPPQSISMNAISDVPVVEQPQGNKRYTMFEQSGLVKSWCCALNTNHTEGI